jgi:hypothetical protein
MAALALILRSLRCGDPVWNVRYFCRAGEMADMRVLTRDRDRGTPCGAAPPTPPGIRVAYLGGSTGLSLNGQHRGGADREP